MQAMKRIACTVLVFGLLSPASTAAQAVWDSPSFLHPGAPSGLTVAVTDASPGDGLGVLGIWRAATAPSGLGFRAGVSETPGDDVVALFGVDVSGSLSGMMGPNEPEALWWTGAGVAAGDDFSASLPLGIVFGWTGRDEGVSFMPYVGGHVALDILTGADDDLDLDGAVDLGLDLAFSSGWTFRFGAAIGGRDALGIGLRVPR